MRGISMMRSGHASTAGRQVQTMIAKLRLIQGSYPHIGAVLRSVISRRPKLRRLSSFNKADERPLSASAATRPMGLTCQAHCATSIRGPEHGRPSACLHSEAKHKLQAFLTARCGNDLLRCQRGAAPVVVKAAAASAGGDDPYKV